MFYTGLVSVSFRKESVDSIIALTKESGLDGIEWGGDVHVPAGDIACALDVGENTRAAGLKVFSYGSYYRLGESDNPKRDFSNVLESAKALGARVVRIWAGRKDPEELSPGTLAAFAKETALLADMALEKGLTLAFECHKGTITSEYNSALSFLRSVERKNVKMYWQPMQTKSEEYNLASAKAYAPFITNVHVFHWIGKDKFPLGMGEEVWRRYMEVFTAQAAVDGIQRAFCLEFMHDGLASSLPETAAVLRRLVNTANERIKTEERR